MDEVGRGTLLAGRYRVLEPEPSTVPVLQTWAAVDEILDRPVRAQVLAPESSAAGLDAARRAALVTDPRLLRVLDVGTHDGLGYVVTEQVSGPSLAQLVQREPLTADQARAVVGEAAAALEVARRRGVHHQALRPSTLCVADDGRVLVSGLALDAALLGRGGGDARGTSRADAVGLVQLLYTALTGRWPGAAVAADGVPAAPVVDGVPAAPADLVPGVPADLDTLCSVTLGPYDDGPHSPAEVVRELEPWGEIRISRPSGFGTAGSSTAAAFGAAAAAGAAAATTTGAAAGGPAGEPEAPPAPPRVARQSVRSAFTQSSPGSGRPGTPPPAAPGRTSAFPAVTPPPSFAAAAGAGAAAGGATGPASGSSVLPGGPGSAAGTGLPGAPSGTTGPTSPSSPPAFPAPGSPATTPPTSPLTTRPTTPPVRPPFPEPPGIAGRTTPTPPAARPSSVPPAFPPVGTPAAAEPPARLSPDTSTTAPQPPVPAAVPRRSTAMTPAGAVASALPPAAVPPVGARLSPDDDPFEFGRIPEEQPGRRRFDPTVVILAIVVLVVVIGVALAAKALLGGPSARLTGGSSSHSHSASASAGQSGSTSPSASASSVPSGGTPVIASGASVDANGTPGDHPEAAAKAVDGDPASFWMSLTYKSAAFGGLKTGIGYVVTLKQPTTVSTVTLHVNGSGGAVEIRATDAANPGGGTVLASGALSGDATFTLNPATSTGALSLWFTQLPTMPDGSFRVELTEVQLG